MAVRVESVVEIPPGSEYDRPVQTLTAGNIVVVEMRDGAAEGNPLWPFPPGEAFPDLPGGVGNGVDVGTIVYVSSDGGETFTPSVAPGYPSGHESAGARFEAGGKIYASGYREYSSEHGDAYWCYVLNAASMEWEYYTIYYNAALKNIGVPGFAWGYYSASDVSALSSDPAGSPDGPEFPNVYLEGRVAPSLHGMITEKRFVVPGTGIVELPSFDFPTDVFDIGSRPVWSDELSAFVCLAEYDDGVDIRLVLLKSPVASIGTWTTHATVSADIEESLGADAPMFLRAEGGYIIGKVNAGTVGSYVSGLAALSLDGTEYDRISATVNSFDGEEYNVSSAVTGDGTVLVAMEYGGDGVVDNRISVFRLSGFGEKSLFWTSFRLTHEVP
jgi:hypothetical protein